MILKSKKDLLINEKLCAKKDTFYKTKITNRENTDGIRVKMLSIKNELGENHVIADTVKKELIMNDSFFNEYFEIVEVK